MASLSNNPVSASHDETQGAKTLHKFQHMPVEIRHMIWDAFIEAQPRKVTLTNYNARPKPAKNTVEALLLINFEAQQRFLQKYTLCFQSASLGGIYINYALDTLCLPSGLSCLKRLLNEHCDTFQGIQWLEVAPSPSDVARQMRGRKNIKHPLSAIPSLKHITLRSFGNPKMQPRRRIQVLYEIGVLDSLLCIRDALGMGEEDYSGPTLAVMFSLEMGLLEFMDDVRKWWKVKEYGSSGGALKVKEYELSKETLKIFPSVAVPAIPQPGDQIPFILQEYKRSGMYLRVEKYKISQETLDLFGGVAAAYDHGHWPFIVREVQSGKFE